MSSTTTITMTAQYGARYRQGEHYVKLSSPLKQAPPVIVFFSFLDTISCTWANKNQVTTTIRRHVPAGTNNDRYHASISQPADFAQDLTAAWAVAKSMQLYDKTTTPLFEVSQDDKTVVEMENIELLFDQIGVPPLRFDREYPKTAIRKDARWKQEVQRQLGTIEMVQQSIRSFRDRKDFRNFR